MEIHRLGHGNGTGAWVTTDVDLCVNRWPCTDEDGKDTDCNFDECNYKTNNRAILRYLLQNNKPTTRDTTMKSKAVGVQQLTSL